MTTASAQSGRANERSAHKIAEKLAKNAGVNLDDWIDEALAEYAEDLGVDPRDLDERERLEAIEERVDRLARSASPTARRPQEPEPRRLTRSEPIRRPRDEAEATANMRRSTIRRDDEYDATEPQASEPVSLEETNGRSDRRSRQPREGYDAFSPLDQAISRIERRVERANPGPDPTRARLDAAIAEIEKRAARNEQRTAHALQSLSGLVEARGGERERLEQAIADVEARSEKTAQRTARALESLTGMVEARKGDHGRLESAIERISRRAEQSEARTARALESLTSLVQTAPQASAPAQRDDAVAARFDALARRAASPVEPAKPEVAAAAGDDEDTFRLVAERLARRRQRRQGTDDRAPAPEDARSGDLNAVVVADMQRQLRSLADKVDTLGRPTVVEAPPAPGVKPDPAVERIERHLAGLSERVERLAAPDPAKATEGAPEPRRPDPRPLEELARRVDAIRATIERQGARPDGVALSAALAQLNDKLDRASASGSQSAATMAALHGMIGRLEEALQRPTTVSLDSRPIEELARRIDGVRGLVERQAGLAPKVNQINAAVEDLQQKIAAPAATSAEIERMEAGLRQLSAEISALGRAAPVDMQPVEQLAQRFEAMREAIAAREASAPQGDRLERALSDIRAKLDRPAQTPQLQAVDASLRQLAAKVDEATSRPALDPKPIEELARRIETIKSSAERGFAPHAAKLETALGDLSAKLDKSAPELDAALRRLADKIDEAARRPTAAPFDPRLIDDLARRIETVKSAAERGFAPHAAKIEAALGDIRAKLDRPSSEIDAALRHLAAKVEEAATSRPNPAPLDPRLIEDLARRIETVKGAAERGFAPHAAKLEAALGDLSAKLDRPAAEIDAALRHLAAKVEEAASRPASVTLDPRPIEELARRIETVKGVAERGFAPHAARVEAALGEIHAKLDKPEVDAALRHLASRVDEAVNRQATVSLDPRPIEDLARRIESVRESLEAPPALGPQVERLESALGAVAERLDRAQPMIDAQGINVTLAAMNARLEEAFRRPAPVDFDREPIEALAARVEAVRETIERQSEHLDVVGRPIDELGKRLDTLREAVERQAEQLDIGRLEEAFREAVERLDRPGIGPQEFRAVVAAIQALASKIDNATASNVVREDLLERVAERLERPGVETADFAAFAGSLADLAAKVERPASDTSRLEALLEQATSRPDASSDLAPVVDAIADLAAKLDGAEPRAGVLEDLIQDVAARLDAIESKIDARPADLQAPDESIAQLELAVRELAEKLGEARTYEQDLRVLQDRMDDFADAAPLGAAIEQSAQAIAREITARLSAADPDTVLGHIQDIHERLDAISSLRPAPAALERALVELTEELEAFRNAREAVGRGATTLSEMRAEQAQFDRRMDQRFSGVQDILEKLVDRLDRIGPADRGGDPAFRAAPPAANRAAMLDIPERSLADARPAASPTVDAGQIAAQARPRDGAEGAKTAAINAHIAAARRAANVAASDSERKDEIDSARKAAQQGSFGMAQRAAALINQHRRPVLLGAAGALTVLTGVTMFEMRGHAPVRKSELTEPATPLAQAEPAPQESATADTSPTGAIAAAPKVISSPLTETAPATKPPATLLAALPAGLGATLTAAAANGEIGAEVEIAQRFLEGRTVPRDPKAAAQWMQAAADAGSVFAQYRLGALYEKGVGAPRDAARARELYTKAANGGNARAMHNLAVLYAQDGGAGKPDYASALEWFRKAASYGVRDSQFNLGVLYGRGLGAPQDLAQSWMWFSVAAKQGDTDAARKRDEVANRMDGRAMSAGKALFDAFQAKTPDPAVNNAPPAPASAADDAPAKEKAAGVKS